MKIKYTGATFAEPFFSKRGSTRNINNREYSLVLDTETHLLECIDNGSGGQARLEGFTYHIPMDNVTGLFEPTVLPANDSKPEEVVEKPVKKTKAKDVV